MTMVDVQNCTILFLAWLASIALFRTIWTKLKARAQLPPGPRPLPIIGNQHLLRPIAHQALHKLSLNYGPLMCLFFGSKPCVVVSSPEMAQEVLKTHETLFLNRPNIANIDYLTYGSSDLTRAPYGPYWKFMKKICMSELLNGQTVEQFRPIRQEEVNRFLQQILSKAKAGETFDVRTGIVRLTSNVISRMALTHRSWFGNYKTDEMRQLVGEMNDLVGKGSLLDLIWFLKNLDLQGLRKRLKNARDQYNNVMEGIIKECEEVKRKRKESSNGNNPRKDVLESLLDIYEDSSSEIKLTRENVKALIMNLLGAGTDSIAFAIEWAFSELINNPEVMEKARKEIDSVVGKTRIVEETDIPNLPYIQAIVKESLRLHPTGPLFSRESSEECTIKCYKIPAKTKLIVNIWSINRDPNHWENPLEFRPERFINEEWNEKKQFMDVRGQCFSLLPFGAGRRSCPGSFLALQVMMTTLGAMVQCFEWKVNGDGENETVDMEEAPGLSLKRVHPLICVPVARLSPIPLVCSQANPM
ncbi:cytochrome P450 93A3-like [Carica papaya]|uniref:cytochrome P450 93A3-like n=1 Tax=Carica papaya TaxID=3649 RepID=UPI000B8C89BF|nr:cytochrome P450 93A3-like [Carica papaya]